MTTTLDRVLPAEEAAAFLARHHYLGTNPRGCVALGTGDPLAAVAVYGPPHVPRVPKAWLELRRLAAADTLAFPLSQFLASTMRRMRAQGVVCLITYADPGAGHHGGIYQATNWVHAPPKSYCWNSSYRLPDGGVRSHRDVFNDLGTTAKKKVAELRPDWVPFLPPMKYRYIYPLGIPVDEALGAINAVRRASPKPDVEDTRPFREDMRSRR
jgi:hypothetical protein